MMFTSRKKFLHKLLKFITLETDILQACGCIDFGASPVNCTVKLHCVLLHFSCPGPASSLSSVTSVKISPFLVTKKKRARETESEREKEIAVIYRLTLNYNHLCWDRSLSGHSSCSSPPSLSLCCSCSLGKKNSGYNPCLYI